MLELPEAVNKAGKINRAIAAISEWEKTAQILTDMKTKFPFLGIQKLAMRHNTGFIYLLY